MASKKTMEIGKRYFRVLDPIFHRTIHVLLNHTAQDWQKWCKKNSARQDDADFNMANFAAFSSDIDGDDKPTEWIIFIKSFEWSIQDMGSLIHEITHTVVKIFDANNIPFNMDTQEFLAHAIGNIYEDISVKIHRMKRSRIIGK